MAPTSTPAATPSATRFDDEGDVTPPGIGRLAYSSATPSPAPPQETAPAAGNTPQLAPGEAGEAEDDAGKRSRASRGAPKAGSTPELLLPAALLLPAPMLIPSEMEIRVGGGGENGHYVMAGWNGLTNWRRGILVMKELRNTASVSNTGINTGYGFVPLLFVFFFFLFFPL